MKVTNLINRLEKLIQDFEQFYNVQPFYYKALIFIIGFFLSLYNGIYKAGQSGGYNWYMGNR